MSNDVFTLAAHKFSKDQDDYLNFELTYELAQDLESDVYIEHYCIFSKDGVVVRSTEPELSKVETGNKSFEIFGLVKFFEEILPDAVQVHARIFSLETTIPIDFNCPPQIKKEGGSFSLNSAPKGLLGGSKWKGKAVTVESVVLQNNEDAITYTPTVTCTKPINTLVVVTAETQGSSSEGLPMVLFGEQLSLPAEQIDISEKLKIIFFEFSGATWLNDIPEVGLQLETSQLDKSKKEGAVSEDDIAQTKKNKSGTKILEFTMSGPGSEFQYHQLNSKEAQLLQETVDAGQIQELIGHSWENSICDGVCGIHADELSLYNETDDTSIDIGDVITTEIDNINDSEGFEQPNRLDVFYFAPSKMTGRFSIEIEEAEEFDPSALEIIYTSYELEGYPERYGKPISAITYMGEDVYPDFEDNGGPSEFLFIGYKFEDNDFIDHIVVYENLFGTENQPENIDWGLLEDIFPEVRVSSDGKTNLSPAEKNDADFFQHDVMLVSISKSIKEEGQIYDASRYQWRASLKRAKAVEYVIAHTSGSIKGVFLPEKWLPSNAEEFSGLSDPKDGRIGFIGKPAPAKVLSLYLNNQIPKSYFPKGASNPVRFVEGNGVEKTNSQETRQNEKGEDAAMSNDVDWKSVAEKSFNRYFNAVRKFDDFDMAEDSFNEEMQNNMEDAGIEDDEGWERDLHVDGYENLVKHLSARISQIDEEMGYDCSETVGPFHTFFSDILSEWSQDTDKRSESDKAALNKLVDAWNSD